MLLLFGCEEHKIQLYDIEESKVFFQVQTFSGANGAEGYSTSTAFSFVGFEQEFTQVRFNGTVKLMGEVKEYDRPVKVVVDNANTTMNEGIGFEIDLDTLIIKAGENSAQIGVRFLRTLDLRISPDTLTLKLEPNEHFSVLEEYKSHNDWRNSTAAAIDGTRYTFIISEVYTRPNSWIDGSPLYVNRYFGEWNPTRFIYINDFLGFTLNDWVFVNSATSKLSIGRMPFYARQLQEELQRRADSGNPVLDEDGSFMQLPEPYGVDY